MLYGLCGKRPARPREEIEDTVRPWRSGPSDRRGYHHGNLKEALIEAARRFIAERGIGGFTLVDAARLVGVSPAALYRHFRGREALLEEVAERGFTELAARLARALRGPARRWSASPAWARPT